MRLVDRILRPMFPKDYHADVQIMISLNSHDENVAPDSLAALAASAAIAVSDIPFNGPISEYQNAARSEYSNLLEIFSAVFVPKVN